MSYKALDQMRNRNSAVYGIDNSVSIPDLPDSPRGYGKEALLFIREDCEDLKHDTKSECRITLEDSDGKSASPNQIPFNMERDIDRLSFEASVGRFLRSGARKDAFDVYFCFSEIFQPFGGGYNSTRLLLELLSEHEENASSLLMKHRDHYSHSVYVFLIGLAIFRNNNKIKNAYREAFGLSSATSKELACHFLEYWGLTSLFHDIGYPFEIAHQQMKAYVCAIDESSDDKDGFAPYVSYKNMERFDSTPSGSLNEMFAEMITVGLSQGYLTECGKDPQQFREELMGILKDRAVHEDSDALDYLFMDHAYFSGIMLAKVYIDRHPGISSSSDIPLALRHALVAIILHNSLFKFQIRDLLGTKRPLSIEDGQPLAYLLMLCDELQCWDRASYGHRSRAGLYPFDFDISFEHNSMRWIYYFDEVFGDVIGQSKAYRDLVARPHCKFIDDIASIVNIRDVLEGSSREDSDILSANLVSAVITTKERKTGLNLSDTNYLNLYDFAVELHGSYANLISRNEKTEAFESQLSLEYKLSNIAQAKSFADHLALIGCFYTDRPVDYPPVFDFLDLIREPGHEDDLAIMSIAEHDRWQSEKMALGWKPGNAHVRPSGNNNIMRERTRMHHDLIEYDELTHAEQAKDTNPILRMLELMRKYDGLTVYRV